VLSSGFLSGDGRTDRAIYISKNNDMSSGSQLEVDVVRACVRSVGPLAENLRDVALGIESHGSQVFRRADFTDCHGSQVFALVPDPVAARSPAALREPEFGHRPQNLQIVALDPVMPPRNLHSVALGFENHCSEVFESPDSSIATIRSSSRRWPQSAWAYDACAAPRQSKAGEGEGRAGPGGIAHLV
jgi:hypothetical protein